MNTKNTLAATAVLALGTLTTQAAESSVKNVVLVHGGFVDGSGWSQVYRGLRKDGYNVAIVQNPTTSLADDVAATKLVISQISGTVILVGHSYGGVVISEAGNITLPLGYFASSSGSRHASEKPKWWKNF